jgi:hypothetical protein
VDAAARLEDRVSRRLALAAVLALLAAGAVLLAADLRAWDTALEDGDAVYAVAPTDAAWRPGTYLGGAAGRLLGVQDDLAVRRALRLYAIAAQTHARLDNATQVQTARAAAQDSLLAVAQRGDAKRAAQARTLLGVLTYGAAATGGDSDQVEAAVAYFTDAVREDAGNDAAKFDLELLLHLSAAHGTRAGQGVGGGSGRGNRRGAGGGSPGRGY